MPFGCQDPHLATFLAQTTHTPGAACDKMRLREIEEGGTGGGQGVIGETERVELRHGRAMELGERTQNRNIPLQRVIQNRSCWHCHSVASSSMECTLATPGGHAYMIKIT